MKTDDFRGLPFEEKSLVMGCYYLECFKIKKTSERVVTEAKKALINSASEFSEKIEKQRHFSEKQISMIMPTDAMRVELHKAINNSEADVTEKALKLLDAYSGDTFTKSYERVKNQNESK